MAVGRVIVLASICLSIAACSNVLPRPDYVSVKTPPPYRTAVDGSRVDNEDFYLDAQGFRINGRGERVNEVDVPAKTGSQPANSVGGYYVSSTGAHAPGR